MEGRDKQYVVTTPEEYFGEVAGKLTVLGAKLVAVENKSGMLTIQASAQKKDVHGFNEWLVEITAGKGSFIENA